MVLRLTELMIVDGPHCMSQVGVTSLSMFPDNISVLVSAGQEEVVQELVGAGADINRKNDKGIAPLFVFQFLSVSAPYMLYGTLGTMRPPSHVLRSEPCPTFPGDHTHFLTV
jgi:hypothetical protein